MNILIVKLSSLGDVLHTLPVVWDIRSRYPDARVDWLVEEAYVNLLQPLQTTARFKGIDHIIPIGLRRWKKNFSRLNLLKKHFSEFKKFRRVLRATSYDLIIDLQGLIKSGVVCALAKRNVGGIIAGRGNHVQYAGYEPAVRLFYNKKITTPVNLMNAVQRSRWVAAAAIGADAANILKITPQFYPAEFVNSLTQTRFNQPYVLCFHATSADKKRWPDHNWVALGKALADQGLTVIFPWGSAQEKQISETLAVQVPNAIVPKAFSIEEGFGLIAHAEKIIGVDTGLVHVSAALNKPTVEIYCASYRENAEGFWSNQIKNLGNNGQPPTLEDVLAAL